MSAKGISNLFIALLLIPIFTFAQTEKMVTTGYKNGSLIVIGGGRANDEVMKEFYKLSGSESAKIVVIPTANVSNDKIDTSNIKAGFIKYGFTDITILHTSDPKVANTEDFIKPIQQATGLFFTGGRQWKIADGFLHTKAHEEMFKLLDRNGVIAGTSAGATIQGSYLARGDSKNNQIMMGDHEEGLGFITNIAIDQHVLARNRQFDLFEILQKKPELLGIGIDESTAIVVKGDRFEVMGASYVLVYDTGFWSREGHELKKLPQKSSLFYFLKSGDKYNMKERKVITK